MRTRVFYAHAYQFAPLPSPDFYAHKYFLCVRTHAPQYSSMRARTYVRTNYIFCARNLTAPHRSMRMRKVSTFPRVRMPRCIKKLVRLTRKYTLCYLISRQCQDVSSYSRAGRVCAWIQIAVCSVMRPNQWIHYACDGARNGFMREGMWWCLRVKKYSYAQNEPLRARIECLWFYAHALVQRVFDWYSPPRRR